MRSLSADDLAQLVPLASADLQEDARERLISASFTAWLMGSGKDKTFDQYCKSLGLVTAGAKETKTEKQALAARAAANVERILAMDKKRCLNSSKSLAK